MKMKYCPWCNRKLDDTTNIGGEGEGEPGPGDFTVCLYCASVLEFGPMLELRAIPDSKWVQSECRDRIRAARRLVLSMDRRTK